MRSPARFVALALVLWSAPAWAAPWDKPGWNITFHDEFDTGVVDSAKWTKRYKWGEAVINQELQAYIDDAFEFDGDLLRIVGRHEAGDYAGQTMAYTSGVLSSVHEQKFGYFEIRCRMPGGQGLWPAFWLLGGAGAQGVNEIDIHEFLGHQPDTMYMTIHWGPSYDQGHESSGGQFAGPDFTQDFHTFAVDWDPQRVIWYVDDVERFRYTGAGVPQANMYVIANLAIGGGWPGSPDGTTPFPSYYDVDYVRVYERTEQTDGGVDGGSAATDGSAGTDGEAIDASTMTDGAATDGSWSQDAAGAEAATEDAGKGDSGPMAANLDNENPDGCACRQGSGRRSTATTAAWFGVVAGLFTAMRRRRPSRSSS